jgi:hypothetical protein
VCPNCWAAVSDAAVTIDCVEAANGTGLLAAGSAGCSLKPASAPGAVDKQCRLGAPVAKVTAYKAARGRAVAAREFSTAKGDSCTCGAVPDAGDQPLRTQTYELKCAGHGGR